MGGWSQGRKKIIPICCRESRQYRENGEQIFPRMQNSNSVCVRVWGVSISIIQLFQMS